MKELANLNWLDVTVISIILISAFIAYRRGFIITIFRFCSLILTLVLSYNLFPYVSEFIRKSTPLFDSIKGKIGTSLNLNHEVIGNTLGEQVQKINGLNLPKVLKDGLLENNNYEIYNILKVDNINDYISSYLANISINIISIIVVFIIVSISLKIVVHMLDIVSKLPILNTINKTFGLIVGALGGVVTVWIIDIIITYFYTNPSISNIIIALEESVVAKFLYQNNILLNIVLTIFD